MTGVVLLVGLTVLSDMMPVLKSLEVETSSMSVVISSLVVVTSTQSLSLVKEAMG